MSFPIRLIRSATLCLSVFGACSLSSPSRAQLMIYTSESSYLSAAGAVSFESFEGVAPRARSTDAVTVSAFSVTPAPGLLGVQNDVNSPENGFGASAQDGTHYLFMYRPSLAAGTLRFDLTRPTNTFGFYLSDDGETAGALTFHTDAGETVTETTLDQYPPILPSGNVRFYGFTQSTPFTQVFLTSTGIDDSFGLDKVYTRSAPVPAPGSLVTLLFGLVPGAGWLLRRRSSEAGANHSL